MPPTSARRLAGGLLAAFGILLAGTRLGRKGSAWPIPIHVYFGVQTGLVAGLVALHPDSPFPVLYFILSAQAMVYLPIRSGVLWITAFALMTGGVYASTLGWRESLLRIPLDLGGYLFSGAFGYALAHAEDARRETQTLLEELRVAHRQLREFAAHAEELAVAAERGRLARELHDALGYYLTVASVR